MTTYREVLPGLEVEFTGRPRWVDSGIGHYEWHGYKGNDQRMELVCEDIDWNHTLYTPEQNIMIDQYLESHCESIEESLCVNYNDQ
jgi:hypothetical protein